MADRKVAMGIQPETSPADSQCVRRPRHRVGRRGLLVLSLPLLLGSCEAASVLNPKGIVGVNDETILVDSLVIMLAIVVPVMIAIFAFAWWFRASNTRAIYLPDFEYSGRIELVVWSIPLMVIILLGGVAWIGSHELDPAVPLAEGGQPLEIEAVSLDWKWLFIYPKERIASVNRLVMPTGTPVHFSLTSGSVMTAFFIPQLGSMIYTMNGMRTQLNLRADQSGTYRGEAAHFSGDGFPDMHFVVDAVPADQFTAWVNDARNRGSTLDAASYGKLAQQSVVADSFTYATVDPMLFEEIVTQKVPPGPGPQSGRPNPETSPHMERSDVR
jgi:cytochrome o ubiquinol oxidase subunit 2